MIALNLRHADTLVHLGTESVSGLPSVHSTLAVGPDLVPYEVVRVILPDEPVPSIDSAPWVMCRQQK